MGETTDSTEEIQNLPEAEVLERVAVLDAEQLTALRALEAADTDGGRAAVLAAIDAKLAEPPADAKLAEPPADAKPETAGERKAREKAEAAARKAREKADAAQAADADADAPAWQAPGYTGPLDIAQANWRSENIKPAREVRGK